MHCDCTRLRLHFGRLLLAVCHRVARVRQLRPIPFDRRSLAHRGVPRDHHVRCYTTQLRCQRHCHAMIAGGLCDHTAMCLLIRQTEDRIYGTPSLKRTRALEDFTLEVYHASRDGIDRVGSKHWRTVDKTCDPLLR